jgi:hypothetical protein
MINPRGCQFISPHESATIDLLFGVAWSSSVDKSVDKGRRI